MINAHGQIAFEQMPYSSRSRSRSSRSSRSHRTRYAPANPVKMKVLNYFDDLGIFLICQPILFLLNLEPINLLDDIGITFIIRPLRYLYRFAEIILQAD
jgi:hypothetical protein